MVVQNTLQPLTHRPMMTADLWGNRCIACIEKFSVWIDELRWAIKP